MTDIVEGPAFLDVALREQVSDDSFEFAGLGEAGTGAAGIICVSGQQNSNEPGVKWFPMRCGYKPACPSIWLEEPHRILNPGVTLSEVPGVVEAAEWIALDRQALLSFGVPAPCIAARSYGSFSTTCGG